MSAEAKKLELIMWISVLKDKSVLESLLVLKEKTMQYQKTGRQAGWAKHMIKYVAPDFDETPEGFEDYLMPKVILK
ncbi:MAG: hypothetical protein WCR52_12055 [Bacteroidota bacterium]